MAAAPAEHRCTARRRDHVSQMSVIMVGHDVVRVGSRSQETQQPQGFQGIRRHPATLHINR
jgi:hypothetical protein